jgi:Extensin-like protein C-terminus
MWRSVRWKFVGSFVLLALAGCGGGWFVQEREPWRHEAEVACLKSGAVRVSPTVAQLSAINGPGMCGADFPLKVAALGENALLGFADEIRPPGAIPRSALPSRITAPAPQYQQPAPAYPSSYSQRPAPPAYGGYPAASGAPLSLEPPGTYPDEDEPADSYRPAATGGSPYGRSGAVTAQPLPPLDRANRARPLAEGPYEPPQSQPPEPYYTPAPRTFGGNPSYPAQAEPLPRLGPATPLPASGPVTVTPAATLACPVVSQLDQWIAGSVQPAAMRWFGQPVAEIRQISAYSCRGMNGNPRSKISEHAFGNALDISAFTLADGRKVTVKDGWRGLPEERGFLRDVHAAACEQFTTVLAPGSNVYHYDHIHVDLMRRSSGRGVCNPAAVPGDLVAGRIGQSGEVTGSLGKRRTAPLGSGRRHDPSLPQAVAGED